MKTAFRILAAALLALWLAIPGISGDGEGGENAGGTGVWILPRCSSLTSNTPSNGLLVSQVPPIALGAMTTEARFRVSNECGATVASLFDGASGTPIALPVVGQYVVLPVSVMQGLLTARIAESDIVIIDAAHRGYLLHLSIDLVTGLGRISIY